jgi:hypothetical protein
LADFNDFVGRKQAQSVNKNEICHMRIVISNE